MNIKGLFNNRVNLWVDEHPFIDLVPYIGNYSEVNVSALKEITPQTSIRQMYVTLRFVSAVTFYGLIGAHYIPIKENAILSVKIPHVFRGHYIPGIEALADDVYNGLEQEFIFGMTKGFESIPQYLSPGILTINYTASSEVGSSQMIFYRLGQIIGSLTGLDDTEIQSEIVLSEHIEKFVSAKY